MTVFNDDERPHIWQAATIEKEGYNQKKLTIYSHNGTHVDAPAHMLENGKTLDSFPVDKFHGKAVVAEVSDAKEYITPEMLKPLEKHLHQVEFLLLSTGWAKKWGTKEYKDHFPVLSAEAAGWPMQFPLKGIGLDTISIDPADSVEVSNHLGVLGNDIIIIENLTNLDKLGDAIFYFSCYPLSIEQADGSPVRAVAIV